MKLVIAITGASGVQLGKKFVDFLPESIEVHVIVSDNALTVESFENKKVTLHSSENIAASISSIEMGLAGLGTKPFKLVTSSVTGTIVTWPSASTRNSTLSPGFKCRRSRITLGMVICPLDVSGA